LTFSSKLAKSLFRGRPTLCFTKQKDISVEGDVQACTNPNECKHMCKLSANENEA
jgi:hypothetical protein